MTYSPHITVTIVFHREGALALPALSSMSDLVESARGAGLTVEARAVLDRPDDLTRHLVAAHGNWLSGVDEISAGDLGLARNTGVSSARGEFVAFLDGDDLWGSEWLLLAYQAATSDSFNRSAIWHPESIYYFSEGDFDRHSKNSIPNVNAKSFHMQLWSSEAPGFDRDMLLMNNIWTANVFACRSIYVKFPYLAVDQDQGFGVEDWSWNIATLWGGVPHCIVPNTVHLVRVKEIGSLGQQNTAEGLLPHLPSNAWPKLGFRRDLN